MNRIISNGLLIAGLVASLGLVGCGSDSGSGGGSGTADAGGTDTSGTADTAGGGSDTAGSDAGSSDTAGGGSDTTADTAADPCASCADNEVCENGKCVVPPNPCGGPCVEGEICDLTADGGKGKCFKPTCALPDAKTFTENTNINKVIKLSILKKDQGCDLDNDAVPNNALGAIYEVYPQADTLLGDTVKDGTVVILLAPDAYKTDGTEFTCDLLLGDIDPSTKDCDASQATGCKYTVSESSYNQFFNGTGTCPAVVTFDPVTVSSGLDLKAGGDKQNFDLTLPVAGIVLKIRISRAQLTGKADDATAWKKTTEGQLCGVIIKEDLDKAIDDVPDAVIEQSGFDKATLKTIVGSVLKADIDTDGDDEMDAISVALSLETAAAVVTGFTAK